MCFLFKGRCCGLVPILTTSTFVALVIIVLALLNYLDIIAIVDFGKEKYENLRDHPVTTKLLPLVKRYSAAFIDTTGDYIGEELKK